MPRHPASPASADRAGAGPAAQHWPDTSRTGTGRHAAASPSGKSPACTRLADRADGTDTKPHPTGHSALALASAGHPYRLPFQFRRIGVSAPSAPSATQGFGRVRDCGLPSACRPHLSGRRPGPSRRACGHAGQRHPCFRLAENASGAELGPPRGDQSSPPRIVAIHLARYWRASQAIARCLSGRKTKTSPFRGHPRVTGRRSGGPCA